MKMLHIGFKGKNNTSSMLVKSISANGYLLTNSFKGLKRDIESLSDDYDCVILFGIDKNLCDTVRIERVAEKGTREVSLLDLESMSAQLDAIGIVNYISNKPTRYLCNEAYWHLLRKFNGKAVLVHIPSIKNMNEMMHNGLESVFG